MSGVITNGQQWEHCNHCGKFVKIQDLKEGFSPRWPDHKWVDLCPECYSTLYHRRRAEFLADSNADRYADGDA